MTRARFFKARRRRQHVPAQFLLCAAVFAGVAYLSEQGWMPRKDGPNAKVVWPSSMAPREPVHESRQLAEFDWGSGAPICAADIGIANSTYPDILVGSSDGAKTAVMLFVTFYMFLGLAIVCDKFFEASLSAICEAQNLKDDVAGATWMAAGGSAPELATSILGVFISKSDVGFGTIVGSAVFNVLFVIACCAFVAPNLKLTWWPLARDCAYYCFSLAMLVIFVSDDLQVAIWEAIVLFTMYIGYVTIMYFNERLEQWVIERTQKNSADQKKEGMMKTLVKIFDHPAFAIMLYLIVIGNSVIVFVEMSYDSKRTAALPCVCGVNVGETELPYSTYYWVNLGFNVFFIVEMLVKFYGYGFFGYWKVPLNCFDGSLVFLIVVEFILTESSKTAVSDPLADSNDGLGVSAFRFLRVLRFVRFLRVLRLLRLVRAGAKTEPTQVVPEGGEKEKEEAPTEDEEEEDDDDEPYNPFDAEGGLVAKFFWVIGLPLGVLMWLTIPDCRREMFKKAWLGTFTMCIVWIAVLATMMVWMVDRFGKLYGVPDAVMGYTLLAAGTSIPDCLSSIAVARRGHGDMAVSSSIGSNIFDVLIGLPIPWILYTGILRPAIGASMGPQWVPVQSASLAVLILSLFVMVALVVTTIHLSGWILSIKLGMMMMFLYFLFLALAFMLEYDVLFGDCSPSFFTPPSAPPISG